MVSLSEYDQTLAEARQHNRMVKALNIFAYIAKNEYFKKTSIMLFFNKKDIFAEKVMYCNIKDSPFFSDYDGPTGDFEHGLLYFIQKFGEHLDVMHDSFIDITSCATDTENIQFLLDSTNQLILEENLKRLWISLNIYVM